MYTTLKADRRRPVNITVYVVDGDDYTLVEMSDEFNNVIGIVAIILHK